MVVLLYLVFTAIIDTFMWPFYIHNQIKERPLWGIFLVTLIGLTTLGLLSQKQII